MTIETTTNHDESVVAMKFTDEVEYLIVLRNDAVDPWPKHQNEWIHSMMDCNYQPLAHITMHHIWMGVDQAIRSFTSGQWSDGSCVSCGRWGGRCICSNNCMCHVPGFYCHHHMK